MDSDQKTLISSLIDYIHSDLFTLENISSSVKLQKENTDGSLDEWNIIIDYLPLEFYRLIESYPNMVTIEPFDSKYRYNPKMCAYEKYGSTNMWRALMILNRCPCATKFNFEFIKHYNVERFTNVLSVLMTRVRSNE